MSQDFLSQEEVDALLKGVTGESDAAPETSTPEAGSEESTGVRKYDIGRQERIVRGRPPTLELIHERFARYLRLGLFNYMRRHAEVTVGSIRVQKYSEFTRNLVVPTNLNMVQVKPLRGTGLFVLDPNLVFLVIDNMFGGDGRFHTRVEGREFTITEMRIVMGLLHTIFTEYEKAWKSVYPLQIEYMRSEMNTQFANIATPAEVVVAVTFTIEFSGTASEMHICLPYSMLEPIRDQLSSTMNTEHLSTDRRWSNTLRKQLKTASVELVAPLGSADVTLRQIMALKTGDVIPFEISDLLTVTSNNAPVLTARYGVKNGQYALKIEQFLPQEALQEFTKSTPKEIAP